MPAPVLAMDHVALRVRDPAATLTFYSDVLGLALVDVFSGEGWDGMDWLMMIFALGDGRELALCALDGPDQPGDSAVTDLPHYAFSVKDEATLERWRTRLKAHDVRFGEENHGEQNSIYFKDPNGFVLEITAPPSAPGGNDRDARKAAEDWIKARRFVRR
jgi:catechol 2,3-dioxygenase-like lactoylglutathione lyase family enzyme